MRSRPDFSEKDNELLTVKATEKEAELSTASMGLITAEIDTVI